MTLIHCRQYDSLMIKEQIENEKQIFNASVEGYLELVAQIIPTQWNDNALGVWTLRDLVGHSARALATIENYLDANAGETFIGSPAEYFQAAMDNSTSDQVAQRGIEMGKALGDNPFKFVDELARRVLSILSETTNSTQVATPWGTMALIDYLPTRTFELTVHSLDIAHAINSPIPKSLKVPIQKSCELAGHIASKNSQATQILLALTGRVDLPKGTNVLQN